MKSTHPSLLRTPAGYFFAAVACAVASISQRACSAIALALSTLTLPYCLAQLRSPLVEPPAAARHVTGHHVECCIALTALAPGDAAACRQRRQCRRGWVRGSERAGQSSDGLTISLVRLLPLASLELKPPSAPCECTSAPALHGRLVALQVPCVPAPTSPSSSAASALGVVFKCAELECFVRQPSPSRLFFSSASSF
ncbi:hypothetical protein PAHAL_9G526000 [Panicum hallii]|uniref:Uncharacterized protein n=1 Tax=Panicum hallii TaxID=206008 RepID=A0A2T8I5I3_9POAL|nr:hypothetical protein PAHAL_9G526000 [Panicum hallii]